jgi:cytochrome P450 family 135
VLAAGHETTATAVAWAFERLVRTPRVLDRLTQSLAEGDEYLEATIKETLRMRPVVTDVGRLLTREIELGGYRIPAGALVMPAITAIHFREDLYPEPDAFIPERFLGRTPEPYTWIPFGGGVRRCIGAAFAQFEMRVIIRTILERARLRAASPRRERSKLRNVTSAPARGCRVVVEGLATPLGVDAVLREQAPDESGELNGPVSTNAVDHGDVALAGAEEQPFPVPHDV